MIRVLSNNLHWPLDCISINPVRVAFYYQPNYVRVFGHNRVVPLSLFPISGKLYQITDLHQKSSLDVSFERSVQKLTRHIQSKPLSPLFLLHFGVSRSPYLRIEKQAVNEKNASIPDIDGVHCDGVTIDSKYALTKSLSSSIQTDKLMQHLQKIGFPTKVSNDAGRYVCNSTYYHSLQWTQSQHASTTTSSIFIHVPPNSCIFFEDNRQFIWTSKVLCEAGKEILEWMIEEHVNRTFSS